MQTGMIMYQLVLYCFIIDACQHDAGYVKLLGNPYQLGKITVGRGQDDADALLSSHLQGGGADGASCPQQGKAVIYH